MSIVLSNNTLTAQLPQPRVVITTRRDQVRAICTECAVPDPALMAVQCGLEGKGGGVAFSGGGQVVAWLQIVGDIRVKGPDACCVVGGAGG